MQSRDQQTMNVQKMIDPEIHHLKMDMSIKIPLLKAQRTGQKRKGKDCKKQRAEGVYQENKVL